MKEPDSGGGKMLRGVEEAAASPSMGEQFYRQVHGQLASRSPTTVPSTPSGPKATRNRQPVSCAACRKSKLKCDRQKPCEACVRRGYREQCFYEAAKVLPRKHQRRSALSHKAQERLKKLEALVMQMAMPAETSGATAASSVGTAGQPGRHESHTSNEAHIMIHGNALKYDGSTHWSAVLDEIQELKRVIVSEDWSEDGHSDQQSLFDPDKLLLFSAPRPTSLERILEALPPRTQVDRYMSTYFKAAYLVLPIVHQGRFQREYEDFWRDPFRHPPLWTSILFSILTTAATVNLMNQSASMEEEQARREQFLGAAAQCLILGNYAKPQDLVLEALVFFAQAKHIGSLDPSREVTLILTLVFRLAFEMGYHKDPEHFSHLSVFEGEMRRRVWAMCKRIDLLQAFQFGLPTYIPHDSYDTKLFSNLPDTGFDEQSTYLPASRPESEPSGILHYLVKCRVTIAFSRAFSSAMSLKPISAEKVMELDREVREAHSTVPPSLQIRPIASSIADSSSVIMARIDVEILFRRTLCTIHRKPMIAGNTYSREVCRESAMSIMTYLIDLRKELQPGGQCHADQWIMSCYTMQDFLLAAMLLCLIVSQRRIDHANEGGLQESQAELAMIRAAYLATHAINCQSKEAKRVSNILASMLSSLEQNFSESSTANQQATPQARTDQDIAAAVAFPAGQLALPKSRFTFEYDPFENLNSIPENIDWAHLGQYYQNQNPNPSLGMNANMFLSTDSTSVVPMSTGQYAAYDNMNTKSQTSP